MQGHDSVRVISTQRAKTMAAAPSQEGPPAAAEGSSANGAAVSVDENGHGRIVFRHELLRKFGTVWETRAVNESPCAGVRFSYFNNSKNAHNSNILQVILRDHGFHKTEPPDTDWNVFWCAGQARAGCSLSAPPPSHRLVILPSLHLLLAPNCAVDIACASLPRGRWIRSRCARSSRTRR